MQKFEQEQNFGPQPQRLPGFTPGQPERLPEHTPGEQPFRLPTNPEPQRELEPFFPEDPDAFRNPPSPFKDNAFDRDWLGRFPELALALEPNQTAPKVHRASDVMVATEVYGAVKIFRVGDDCKCLEIAEVAGEHVDTCISGSGRILATLTDAEHGLGTRVVLRALNKIDEHGQPRRIGAVDVPMDAGQIAISDDGTRLAVVGYCGTVQVYFLDQWDGTGTPCCRTIEPDTTNFDLIEGYVAAAFVPGSTRLITLKSSVTPTDSSFVLESNDVSPYGRETQLIADIPTIRGLHPGGDTYATIDISDDGRTMLAVVPDRAALVVRGSYSSGAVRTHARHSIEMRDSSEGGILAGALNLADQDTVYIATRKARMALSLASLEGGPERRTLEDVAARVTQAGGSATLSIAVNPGGDILAAGEQEQVRLDKVGPAATVETTGSVPTGDWTKVRFVRNAGGVLTSLKEAYEAE